MQDIFVYKTNLFYFLFFECDAAQYFNFYLRKDL